MDFREQQARRRRGSDIFASTKDEALNLSETLKAEGEVEELWSCEKSRKTEDRAQRTEDSG